MLQDHNSSITAEKRKNSEEIKNISEIENVNDRPENVALFSPRTRAVIEFSKLNKRFWGDQITFENLKMFFDRPENPLENSGDGSHFNDDSWLSIRQPEQLVIYETTEPELPLFPSEFSLFSTRFSGGEFTLIHVI